MNYYPTNKSCEELLVLAGFSSATKSIGWEKVLPDFEPGNRLHAFTHHGWISVHYDVMGGPNGHLGKSFHKQVKKCIIELEKLDSPKWSLTKAINAFIHGKE